MFAYAINSNNNLDIPLNSLLYHIILNRQYDEGDNIENSQFIEFLKIIDVSTKYYRINFRQGKNGRFIIKI